jgi:DNA-binding NtrC family response regulator
MARKQDPASTRKTTFEVVRRSEVPLFRGDGQPPPARILSLSYDLSLAQTRELLLAGAGFDVSTYTDTALAIEACQSQDFDLFIIGHTIPFEERWKMLREVRQRCHAPILALLRHGDAPLPGADYFFDTSQSPAQLLETVVNILQIPRGQP